MMNKIEINNIKCNYIINKWKNSKFPTKMNHS